MKSLFARKEFRAKYALHQFMSEIPGEKTPSPEKGRMFVQLCVGSAEGFEFETNVRFQKPSRCIREGYERFQSNLLKTTQISRREDIEPLILNAESSGPDFRDSRWCDAGAR